MPATKNEILCLACKQPTRHTVIKNHQRTDRNENDDTYSYYWDTLECDGCGSVTFRETITSPDFYNPETQRMEPIVRLYPHRTATTRTAKNLWHAPEVLRRLYNEVILTYNNDAPTLCAAGLRALVEGLAKQNAITGGTVACPVSAKHPTGSRTSNGLDGKISGLAAAGILTKAHADHLHKHRFLGNDAVHELKAPDTQSLDAAIELIEHTLENVYELKHTADRIA